MPIYSSNLFDFYLQGDIVKVYFKGSLADVGHTPYQAVIDYFHNIGERISQDVRTLTTAIVTRWLAVEDYILNNNLSVTKSVAREVSELLFGLPSVTTNNTIVDDVEEEDDHIQFEYEF